jgi:hypothetical protein
MEHSSLTGKGTSKMSALTGEHPDADEQ